MCKLTINPKYTDSPEIKGHENINTIQYSVYNMSLESRPTCIPMPIVPVNDASPTFTNLLLIPV